MKIAIHLPAWPPEYASNGIVTYGSHLVPALRRLGHTVFVLTAHKAPDHNDPYTVDLTKYASSETLWRRALYRLAPVRAGFEAATELTVTAIKDLVEHHGIDVFEMEESGGWSYAVSRLKIVPVVVRLHGPWFQTGRFNDPGDEISLFRQREELEGRGIRHAELVTANCEETLNSVKDHYHLKLADSRVIRTPIDAAPKAKAWNVETCAGNTFLFVGRFDKLKGGDLVLHAFAEIAKSNPAVRLVFVGPDKGIRENDGNILCFRDFVEKYIPESIRPQIEFRGRMKHSDLMALRTKCFATVVGAQYDTMGYMILEAMSLGCPLITTAVGGIPEFVKDLKNGLLVPSQNIDEMASACKKLLDDKALAARLGNQAWLDCSELYAPDIIARQTVVGYEDAIKKFRQAKPARRPGRWIRQA